MNEELLVRAQTLQNESQEVEQNIKIINEHIEDLAKFAENLDSLDKSEEKEILASIGRGVYIKSKIDEDKKLFVEIGAGIIVKKTPAETKKVIAEQLKKFEEAKLQLRTQLELYAREFRKMVEDLNRAREDIEDDDED